MVTVIEQWQLKLEHVNDSIAIMQMMDDIVGPEAHEHPGWCEHAKFFQDQSNPQCISMIYDWKSQQLHEDITRDEKDRLKQFIETYCETDRTIHYYKQLPIDVD